MKKNYTKQQLIAKMNAMSKGNVVKDSDGYYQLPTDKNGCGSAIIRFLQPLPGEDIPIVRFFNHAFRGQSGKWFVANCPGTLNQRCPVCDSNDELWNGPHKSLASLRKRKLNYVSNILVVTDTDEPDNEGKVWLYRYSVTIFNKI